MQEKIQFTNDFFPALIKVEKHLETVKIQKFQPDSQINCQSSPGVKEDL